MKIYNQALSFDQDDVEANFNLAGLYLQRNQLDLAMKYFKNSVRKDEMEGYPEIKTLFAQQFSKAYFNLGIIYDHKADNESAFHYYDKAYKKIVEIPKES